jgi:pimeloyl-ACP methyl ester carboxylesterase
VIEEARGRIDYDEHGSGPTVVLVPGSCSTGAAWRPLIAAWNERFRCVTTSLLGYGGTDERRTDLDASIAHEAEVVEAVIRRAASPVHLVGHSFGGLVALAVALRNRAPLASLTIIEAPAAQLLHEAGEDRHYQAFRDMSQAYFAAFAAGEEEAIARMIGFYGGEGTFASWPPRVRAYAVETTAVNIRDWASAYGFPITASALAAVAVPALVMRGGASHPAVQRANDLLSEWMPRARLVTVAGAAHFMITTHAHAVASAVVQHVAGAEAAPREQSAAAVEASSAVCH